MTLLKTSLLLLCSWLYLATLIVATGPALVHEARQGPIQTTSDSQDSTSSTSTPSSTTTMSPSPSPSSSSEPSPSLSTSLTTSPTTSDTPIPTPLSSATSVTTASSGTSSSATPQPSSSAGSLTITVNNMTTCTSGLISWNYTGGKQADLFLSLSDIIVHQDYVLHHVAAKRNTFDTVVTEQLVDTNTSASSWEWSKVNVTQGWYAIQGLVLTSPAITNTSAPFFVSNGTDVSCLTATSSQPSTTTGTPSSGTSKFNQAALVGGLVGGIVGIAFVVLAGVWLCLRKRRKSLDDDDVGGKSQNWGSLKSTASSIPPDESGARLTRNPSQAHSESTGTVIQIVAGGKLSTTSTPGGSEEDVTTVGEEMPVSPSTSPGVSPTDVLNTPIRHGRRTSTLSTQTPTSVMAGSDASRSRSASQQTVNHSLEQQAQRIRYSMESPFRRRSDRLSMPTLPSPSLSRLPVSPTHVPTNSKEEYALSPVTATPINRSVSTSAVPTPMSARRTSRKPVPRYDASVLLEDTNADSVSMITAGAESSQSHGTGMGSGTCGMPPDLVRKASFVEGRPVHYLIPDMPPPQQPED